MKEKTKILAECAVMVALATVLSMIKIYEAPLGGAVTLFSMVPILLLSFRHGVRWGCASAFVYAVIQGLLGVSAVSYVPTWQGVVLCLFLDYGLAFTVIGLAGLLRVRENASNREAILRVISGALLACVLRYCFHVLSGAVVWYEITKAGGWNDYVSRVGKWTYTFVYNAQFMVPETILTLIASPTVVTVLRMTKKNLKK